MNHPPIGVYAALGHAWRQIRKYFLHLFLVSVILLIADNLNWLISNPPGVEGPDRIPMQWLAVAYMMLVLPVINYGAQRAYLEYMRDEVSDIRKIFHGFRDNYLNIVLASLLCFAIIGIGLILLIVPGIIFMIRLSFVPFLVMDKGLEPVAAVEKSWAMTRGHGWRIFGMGLLIILMYIVGLLALVIGAFFVMIWVNSAFAALYFAIDSEEQKRLDQNGAEPASSTATGVDGGGASGAPA